MPKKHLTHRHYHMLSNLIHSPLAMDSPVLETKFIDDIIGDLFDIGYIELRKTPGDGFYYHTIEAGQEALKEQQNG